MRYRDPALRDKLASEYVLGTLRGRARARFRRLLRYDPALRRAVEDWEERLLPLALGVPEVAPPPQLWQKIQDRIAGPVLTPAPRAARPGFWESLTLWRAAAAFASIAALVLAVLLAQAPAPEAPRMMVVLSDKEANPRLTVSWPAAAGRQRELSIRVIGHAEMAPDTAWELWCLPAGGKPPLSVGLVSTDVDQTLRLPKDKWSELDQATGMAMSVEPKGGSPTGLPTGPVIYSGPRVEI